MMGEIKIETLNDLRKLSDAEVAKLPEPERGKVEEIINEMREKAGVQRQ